jgi:hypothetical protein
VVRLRWGADVQEEMSRALTLRAVHSVMETTDVRDRDDWPGGCFRDRSVIWRVFLEPEVRSTPMIAPAIGREDTPEMRFVHDDDVIETRSSDRADRALAVRILPRTRRRGTTSAMPMPASRRWNTAP